MKKLILDLQYFTEGGAPAGGPAGGTGGDGGSGAAETGTGTVNVGDTLANGQQVTDAQVAAVLNGQMKRHPELRRVYQAQGTTAEKQEQPAATAAQETGQTGTEQTPEDPESRWNALKKGEYRQQYARDVQNAVRDRFKNQEDANQKLSAMQPMLDALMHKAGVETVEELQQLILDDDSLYEEEAEKADMPVAAYKKMQQLQKEHDELVAREQRNQQQEGFRRHISELMRQGEELKKTFPGFDFNTEMQNDEFRRLTSPDVGLSVQKAYFAVHQDELVPQLMSYGMERAKQQMGETIKAQGQRPVEGAARGQGQGEVQKSLDFRSMSRREREAIRRRVMDGSLNIPTR